MDTLDKKMEWFASARYGMFVHFGLYSRLGRGEWVMNREQIPPNEYGKLADTFRPVRFDADAICRLAADSGMKYVVFTTMHHDGFRMYDSDLTDFCSTKTGSRRDFVAEIVAACRKHNLKIGLYHSLNNWHDQPDGVAALEDKADYTTFIDNTFARLRELVEKYAPFDIMWYDGWWPFSAAGWRAEAMNDMVRALLPGVIFNGRNGLPGDYATPEQHMTPPSPWRPWEACVTLNDHWGYHAADLHWKDPLTLVEMLATAANGVGNLLLNIGPRGDGSIPEESVRILRTVGDWLRSGGGHEAIFDTELFRFHLQERGDGRGDWDGNCILTAKGHCLYGIMRYIPGATFTLTGLETTVRKVSCANNDLPFSQQGGKLTVDLPERMTSMFCPVLRMACDGPPVVYRTGGMRTPNVPHPRYDPCESDLHAT